MCCKKYKRFYCTDIIGDLRTDSAEAWCSFVALPFSFLEELLLQGFKQTD